MSLLKPRLGEDEARWVMRVIIENLKGWNQADVVMRKDEQLTPYLEDLISQTVDKVASGMPVQYALGQSQWHALTLKVTPDVLIPRPETAQLVDMVIDEYSEHKDLQVLDLGTGSGAIAIALARNLPFSQITAIDINEKALEVARENAQKLKTNITFLNNDILTLSPSTNKYDIIIANPPYVLESEKSSMEARVTDYEPSQALFVPDDDPLKFYLPILRYAASALKHGGKVFLEINPLCVEQLTLEAEKLFTNVTVTRDFRGHLRFMTASKHHS